MKRKTKKKLVLAKETLADLESGLGNVVAGATASCTGCGPPACEWSGIASCATGCGRTCTSNLC
jgi:hypothetical protein